MARKKWTVSKVVQADDDGNMQEDWGLYRKGVVGRTAHGDVVGLFVGSVWT